MTVFSFTHKGTFVRGEVTKSAGEQAPVFEASSEVYPGHSAKSDTMTGAVNTYREGIDTWLSKQTPLTT